MFKSRGGSIADDNIGAKDIGELQKVYLQRLAYQIKAISSELPRLRNADHTESALVNLIDYLSVITSTADTFNLNKSGELATMMLSLVKAWTQKNSLPKEYEIQLFVDRLNKLAHESGIELEQTSLSSEESLSDEPLLNKINTDKTNTSTDTSLTASGHNQKCYELMVSTSTDMLAMIDLDYRHVIANKAYLEQFDLNSDEIIGLKVEDVIGTDTFKQLLKPKMDEAIGGKSVKFESWISLPGRDPMYIDIIYIPYRDHENISGLIATVRDITSRKTIEDNLKDSEFRFRQLAENIPQVFFLKDVETQRMLYVSPAYEDIWEQSCESLYQNPQSFLDTVHPDDRKIVENALEAQQRARPGIMEYRLLREDDSECYIQSQTFPAYDKDGKFVMIAGFAEDITKRHLTSLKLHESEQRFRTIFEMAGVGVTLAELPKGKYIAVNKCFTQMLGYSNDEMMNLSFKDITHPDDVKTTLEHVKKLTSGEVNTFSIEKRYIAQGTNRTIWVNSTVSIAWSPKLSIHYLIEVIEDITEKRLADMALQESESRFRSLTELSPSGVFRTDENGKCVYVNARTTNVVGLSEHDCLNAGLFQTLHTDDKQRVQERWIESIDGFVDFSDEYRFQHSNGELVWVKCQAVPVYNSDAKYTGYIGTLTDITELKQAENVKKQAVNVFANTKDGIVVTDSRARITAVNPAFELITGYTEAAVLGKNPSILKSGRQPKEFYRKMWSELQNTGSWEGEIWNKKHDGEFYPEWVKISTIRDSQGNIINYVGVFSNTSEIKKAQDDLAFNLHNDPLTGLPNRALFYEHIKHAINRAEREKSNIALLFIDLDNFKHINNSLGHNVGDELLSLVAKRLSEELRGNDTISRIGGDEFTILIEDLDSYEEISTIAQKIIGLFYSPFKTNESNLYITPSIGISIYPEDGIEPGILLKNADAAMYKAKARGRNMFEFYTPSLTDYSRTRISMEARIHHAMENDEFSLFYQPQYELKTGKIVGAEALIRWHSKEYGEIPPSKFIPLIEDSSMILNLGDLVFEKACQQCRSWQDKGYKLDRLAINIAGRQIQQENFVEKIAIALDRHGISGKMIDLEITEGFIMRQARTEIEPLNKLRSMGISLAIDDFGTGYSSLSYLKLLPVNRLKIDRSFIQDIGKDTNDDAIVKAIIALGHALDLILIAEGVETETQHAFLRNEACDQMQGFLLSSPLPADEFEKLLQLDMDANLIN